MNKAVSSDPVIATVQLKHQSEENRNFDRMLAGHEVRISSLEKEEPKTSSNIESLEKKTSSKIEFLEDRVRKLEGFRWFAVGIAVTSGFFLQMIIKAVFSEP